MKITIALALITIIILSSGNLALAQGSDIGQSIIHPAHPLYFLKTVREIMELKLAGTAHIRGLRHMEFTTRRIREVNSLIRVNHPDLIPPTLEKYWLNLSQLLGLVNFKDQTLANQVLEAITAHLITLQRAYQQTDNPQAKMAIRTTVNRVSEWNGKLWDRLTLDDQVKLSPRLAASQKLACNFLSGEASSAAYLNEVERVVLLDRAEKCLKLWKQLIWPSSSPL